MDFITMDAAAVINGTDNNGVRYLQLFLQEYTALFNESVNAGCNKCLTTYITRYKNHFKNMENSCKYRLHAKYENIPLEFGSPILVNNGNITDEYAKKLLQHNNGERYFSELPPGVTTSSKPEVAKPNSKKAKQLIAKQAATKNETIIKEDILKDSQV